MPLSAGYHTIGMEPQAAAVTTGHAPRHAFVLAVTTAGLLCTLYFVHRGIAPTSLAIGTAASSTTQFSTARGLANARRSQSRISQREVQRAPTTAASSATGSLAGAATSHAGLGRLQDQVVQHAASAMAIGATIALFIAALFQSVYRQPGPRGSYVAMAVSGERPPPGPDSSQKEIDEYWMSIALAEGQKGRATAPPNPWVGCCITKDGKLIGKGYHAKAGTPHAEPTAVADALARGYTDDDLAGSTFYVTLEPCSHYGRTPPCADMMVERKVARAVVALGDPDPLVEGRGFKKLEAGGVEVVVGVLEAEANESLGDYLHARRTGTPIPPVQES